MKTNIVPAAEKNSGLSEKQSLALANDRGVSVRAGAGSGKTRTIIEKIFQLLCLDYKSPSLETIIKKEKIGEAKNGGENAAETAGGILSAILCISFTNKAAAELRERILYKINGEIDKTSDSDFKNYLTGISERIGSLEISTLDSFFTSILKRHAFALGLPSGFTPAPGGRSDILFRKAVFNVLDALSNNNEIITGGEINIFEDFYSFYKKKERIHKLFSQILAKAVYLKKPLFCYNSLSEFENAMRQRMSKIESAVKSLELSSLLIMANPSEAMDFLRSESASMAQTSRLKAEELLKRYDQIEEGNLEGVEEFFKYLATGFVSVRFHKETLKSGIEKFNQITDIFKKTAKKYFGAKVLSIEDENIKLTQAEFDFFKGLCEIFDLCRGEYKRLKTEENLLDFNDIEELALDAVNKESISGPMKNKYRHILIDEFQDTNDLQAEIIGKIKGGARLTIVGDGMQSIYRFRNANCSLFSKFEKLISAQGGIGVDLDDNYRSSQNILRFINDFFSSLNLKIDHPFSDFYYRPLNALSQKAENKEIAVEAGLFATVIDKRKKTAAANTISEAEAEITANEAAKISPAEDNPAGTHKNETDPLDEDFDAGQFDFIARRAVSLKKEEGYNYGEMMVLLSRMSNIDALARALRAESVPFVITKSRKFYQRPEIIDIYNLIKTLINPYDEISICGLLRSPVFSVPDYIIFALRESFRLKFDSNRLRFSESSPPAAVIKSFRNEKNAVCIYNAMGALSRGELDFNELLASQITGCGSYESEKERLITIYDKINKYINLSEYSSAYDILSAIYLELNLECKYSYSGDFGAAYKNIEKLLAHIHDNSYLPDASIHYFMENFQSVIDIGFSEEENQESVIGDAIKIMTVHQAKGLEEKVVFIPEIEADFYKAMDSDIMVNADMDLAFHPGAFIRLNENSMLKDYYDSVKKYEKIQELFEKKRQLYVAMTRACEKLILSGSFKITINAKDEIKSAQLNKQPFIFSNSHLNQIVNYLDLDADFFMNALEGDGYELLDGPFGRIKILARPPKSEKNNEESFNADISPLPEGIGEKIAIKEKCGSECSAENGRAKVRISYSGYKKMNGFKEKNPHERQIRQAITASATKNARNPEETNSPENLSGQIIDFEYCRQLLEKSLNSAERSPDNLAGSAFHRAAQIVISSGLPAETLIKLTERISKLACREINPSITFGDIQRRVKKMLDGFINNAERCGLNDLFAAGGKQEPIKKYTELKLYYEGRNYILEGICDLITIDAQGAAVIYDFKTINRESRPQEDEFVTQTAFYQLCARNSLSGITDFKQPVIILIENNGSFAVKAIKISQAEIDKKQAEIIRNCESNM